MTRPIKCAVVLAAGFGSRLREADNCPKPLRPVASVPLLVRVLRCLAVSGIERAAVVLGYQADQIREALERQEGLGLELRYLLNEQYAKSNGVSVLTARDFIGDGCVLSMADHLYSPRVVDAVLSPEFADGSCVLGVDYDIPRCFDLDDATKVRVENQRIVEISKSLANYNALDAGVFRIGKSLIEALDSVYRSKGDCSLSDGVQALSRRGEFFASDICGAPWIDVDTPEAARHAAHLIQVLGDQLEAPRPLPARSVFPELPAPPPWGVVPTGLGLASVVPHCFAAAT
ncbi:MAG TPA: NTP transferase domain-containing protein, partial [Polyangiaceae bacterium]|nr:NTP transferase domain-containing protein [Polyangiaceae bacterium]